MNRWDGDIRMIRFGLSPRIARLTRHEAQEYWGRQHAQLFSHVPHLVSYVQNHAVLRLDGEPHLGSFGFDIFSEVEFASPEAMSIAVSSPYYQNVVLPDELALLDASKRAFLLAARKGEGSTGLPNGSIKLVQFRTAAEDVSRSSGEVQISGSASWDDTIMDVAGWPGVQPAIVRQTPYPSVEAAEAAHRLTMDDNAVLLSVMVKQRVIVAPNASDAA